MPNQTTRKTNKHVSEHFGLLLPKATHPFIVDIRDNGAAPYLHGDKIWNSTHLLMDFLHHNPIEANLHVLDIGCGFGVTSVFCAKHFNAHMISNDADAAVFPYVELLCRLNDCHTQPLICRFEEIDDNLLSSMDILIGADICFWDELEEPIYQLIERAINAGIKKIIIADPNRPPFIQMAERCVNEFFGEIIPWKTTQRGKGTGSILIIENA